ncbi:MAG: hypothetical protein ACD_30C00041G0003 [uncultured bacterium]|uniref:Pilus assembly protein n=1 Tax=Candidatus Daviesbacteria bacterium GW2011_GWB1_36_5 TaxID=1618426 RepID=A0A0G0HYY0_9BACT|nr:MAG: hypothetical protein ACD_30C00041G0003 [uncultured bacterium]KKQ09081.1 MAG: Pilus assembly protein [Candidatus Daviesbacteria bacterium GW2011_GWB1_36_5]
MPRFKLLVFANARALLISYEFIDHSKTKKSMNNKLQAKRTHNFFGFTLIELIIAITIVGIIAAIGFLSYSQSQIVARDSKRKQDLQEIAKALQLYYGDFRQFPCTNSWQHSSSTAGTVWITNDTAVCNNTAPSLSSSYISNLPNDPTSNTTGNPTSENVMGYHYWSSACGGIPAGQYYVLATQLENRSDPDRNELKPNRWCDDTLFYGAGATVAFPAYTYTVVGGR